MHFYLFRYLFVISTGVIDCLGRFVPEMTYYVSSGTLNLAHLNSTRMHFLPPPSVGELNVFGSSIHACICSVIFHVTDGRKVDGWAAGQTVWHMMLSSQYRWPQISTIFYLDTLPPVPIVFLSCSHRWTYLSRWRQVPLNGVDVLLYRYVDIIT